MIRILLERLTSLPTNSTARADDEELKAAYSASSIYAMIFRSLDISHNKSLVFPLAENSPTVLVQTNITCRWSGKLTVNGRENHALLIPFQILLALHSTTVAVESAVSQCPDQDSVGSGFVGSSLANVLYSFVDLKY